MHMESEEQSKEKFISLMCNLIEYFPHNNQPHFDGPRTPADHLRVPEHR